MKFTKNKFKELYYFYIIDFYFIVDDKNISILKLNIYNNEITDIIYSSFVFKDKIFLDTLDYIKEDESISLKEKIDYITDMIIMEINKYKIVKNDTENNIVISEKKFNEFDDIFILYMALKDESGADISENFKFILQNEKSVKDFIHN